MHVSNFVSRVSVSKKIQNLCIKRVLACLSTHSTNPTGAVPTLVNCLFFFMDAQPQQLPDPLAESVRHPAACPMVRNFRQVFGFANLYRCADPSRIFHSTSTTTADVPNDSKNNLNNTDVCDCTPCQEIAVLFREKAGLIIDFRSETERQRQPENGKQMDPSTTTGSYQIQTDRLQIPSPMETNSQENAFPRIVLQLDPVYPREQLFRYLQDSITGPSRSDKKNNVASKEPLEHEEAYSYPPQSSVDKNNNKNNIIETLNEVGLTGLNRGILYVGGPTFGMALKAIVEYWEAAVDASNHLPNVELPPIVIHCVQGKDRTGLFSMLCQSIIGISDKDIIEDYHMSEQNLVPWEVDSVASTAAEATLNYTYGDHPKQLSSSLTPKLHREFWVGAPKHVMAETLAWIRESFGSVNDYLDSIEFDASWRQRFCSLTVHGPSRL